MSHVASPSMTSEASAPTSAPTPTPTAPQDRRSAPDRRPLEGDGPAYGHEFFRPASAVWWLFCTAFAVGTTGISLQVAQSFNGAKESLWTIAPLFVVTFVIFVFIVFLTSGDGECGLVVKIIVFIILGYSEFFLLYSSEFEDSF